MTRLLTIFRIISLMAIGLFFTSVASAGDVSNANGTSAQQTQPQHQIQGSSHNEAQNQTQYFAQKDGTAPVVNGTITVENMGPGKQYSGQYVCYRPLRRQVTATRVLHRCVPYHGCHNVRITRDFVIRSYEDCHIQAHPCRGDYMRFGWYPNRFQARDATGRCQDYYFSQLPAAPWRYNY